MCAAQQPNATSDEMDSAPEVATTSTQKVEVDTTCNCAPAGSDKTSPTSAMDSSAACKGADRTDKVTDTERETQHVQEVQTATGTVDAQTHLEAEYGRGQDCLNIIAQAKADVNFGLSDGSTLLMTASRGNNAETVRLLLDAKANVEGVDNFGLTPLHIAASLGHVATVTTLLNAKAQVNVATNTGATPVSCAESEGHVECLMTLLAHSVRINSPVNIREIVHSINALSVDHHAAVLRAVKRAFTVAVKEEKVECLMELVLVSGPRQYKCWYCGDFNGSFDVVKAHENECPYRYTIGGPPIEFAAKVLYGPQPEVLDGIAILDSFRSTAPGERIREYLKLVKDWSRFHHCAAVGDADALEAALLEDEVGFHNNRSNADRPTVANVAQRARQGEFHHDDTAARAPFEPKIENLIKQAEGSWTPKNHKYFGLPHQRGVADLLCLANTDSAPASAHVVVMEMLTCLPRGWFGAEVNEDARRHTAHRHKLETQTLEAASEKRKKEGFVEARQSPLGQDVLHFETQHPAQFVQYVRHTYAERLKSKKKLRPSVYVSQTRRLVALLQEVSSKINNRQSAREAESLIAVIQGEVEELEEELEKATKLRASWNWKTGFNNTDDQKDNL